MRIHDKFPSTKHPRTWSNKSHSKLHNNVQNEKEISHSSKIGDCNCSRNISTHTSRSANIRKEEIKRVYEKRNKTSYKKKTVPFGNNGATRIKNLVEPRCSSGECWLGVSYQRISCLSPELTELGCWCRKYSIHFPSRNPNEGSLDSAKRDGLKFISCSRLFNDFNEDCVRINDEKLQVGGVAEG